MTVTYIHKSKVSPLVVDKLSLTLALSDAELEEVLIAMQLLEQHDYAEKAHKGIYKWSQNAYLDEVGDKKLLMQAQPVIAGIRSFRFECNPGQCDFGLARVFLDFVIPGGYQRLAQDGICTRIDLAVDVRHTQLGDLHVYSPGVTKSAAYYGAQGIETLYLGSSLSEKRTCIYDKRAQLKRKNLDLVIKARVPSYPVTRFEVRLRRRLPLPDLFAEPNAFSRIKVSEGPVAMDEDGLLKWMLMACEGSTTQNVLKVMSLKEKVMFKKRLEKAKADWWQPDAIWSQYGPLIDGLLDPPLPPFSLDQLHALP